MNNSVNKMTKTHLLTSGQLEREFSQRIGAFYRNLFGRQPSQVICHLFANKLVVIAEDSITLPEKILVEQENKGLAATVRSSLTEASISDLKLLIEEISQVKVDDLLSTTSLETYRTALIAVFNTPPSVKNPAAIPKLKKKSIAKKEECKQPDLDVLPRS